MLLWMGSCTLESCATAPLIKVCSVSKETSIVDGIPQWSLVQLACDNLMLQTYFDLYFISRCECSCIPYTFTQWHDTGSWVKQISFSKSNNSIVKLRIELEMCLRIFCLRILAATSCVWKSKYIYTNHTWTRAHKPFCSNTSTRWRYALLNSAPRYFNSSTWQTYLSSPDPMFWPLLSSRCPYRLHISALILLILSSNAT